MKKLLVTALAMMATLSMYAQGTVTFSTVGGAAIQLKQADNTVISCPKNAAPNNFQVQLFYGGAGVAENDFVAIGTPKDLLTAGIVNGGVVNTAGPGTFQFQMRGFGNGTFAGAAGRSTIWTQSTGDPNAVPAITSQAIVGAGKFTGLLIVVPEPSTIALGLLGLAGLFVLRRRS
jgi:hypothetical protein